MFSRFSIKYVQSRLIIVTKFYSFLPWGSEYFWFSACGPDVKKDMFLKCLILLSAWWEKYETYNKQESWYHSNKTYASSCARNPCVKRGHTVVFKPFNPDFQILILIFSCTAPLANLKNLFTWSNYIRHLMTAIFASSAGQQSHPDQNILFWSQKQEGIIF